MCERETDKVNRPNKRRAVTLVQRLSSTIEKAVNLERNDQRLSRHSMQPEHPTSKSCRPGLISV